MSTTAIRQLALIVSTSLTAAIGIAACSVELIPLDSDANGNGSQVDGEPDDGGVGGPENIVVRVRNLSSSDAVRVEFYVADGALEDVPQGLFVDENRVGGDSAIDGQGIGQANSGTLLPQEQDVLTFSCDGELTLGTTGGTFLDNESGEELGNGTPNIWVQQGAQFSCGANVVFEYGPDGDGFKTTLLIGR